MRKDLAKLTTEQERAGGGATKKYGGRVKVHPDPDHDYLKEYGGFRSSARHRQYDYKSLTDVLNPLRGAIRKNLGRPWDDVYSEFARLLDRRSVAGIHIWGHMMDEVATHTYLAVDGRIYEKPQRYSRYPRQVSGFYVHPITGILSYAMPEKYNRNGHQSIRKLPVPGMEPMEYRKIDGLWYRCIVVRQKVYKTVWDWDWEEVFTQKRSCNKKEIRWIKSQL